MEFTWMPHFYRVSCVSGAAVAHNLFGHIVGAVFNSPVWRSASEENVDYDLDAVYITLRAGRPAFADH